MLAANRGVACQRVPAAGRQVKALAQLRGAHPSRSRQACVVARAENRESSGSDGFVTGFVLGGAIFGALGFLLAPQISKALLDDNQKLKMPRFLEEEKDPAQTKQDLIDTIARLNQSIDEVASKLKEPEVVS